MDNDRLVYRNHLKQSIAEKRAELDSLEKELEREQNIPEDIRLAEYLHSAFCVHNHEDACGWYYESWTSSPGNTRRRYLEKARSLLSEGYKIEDVEALVQEYNHVKSLK